MPKALIFDCFGVLVEPSLGYLKSLAETTEQSQQVSDFNLQADLGYISRQTLLEDLSQVLDIPADEVWAIMQQRRLKMPKTIDFLLSKKANGSKIGLLSNVAQDTLETIFPKDELDAMFDEMILSYDTHLVKSDPKIYLLMADKLGVDPSRCVMIDDAVENITGAKSSGMQGVVFKDVDQLESDLSKLGF
jgi:HAD superfamily hydrolase (TIGR01509 family)